MPSRNASSLLSLFPNFFFVSSFRRAPNVKSSTSQVITATKLAVARVEELNEDILKITRSIRRYGKTGFRLIARINSTELTFQKRLYG